MRSTGRRKELLSWLEVEGTLSLAEMVARFGVSKMTIHRDLDLLEQRQVLKRIHGGAARIERALRERDSQGKVTLVWLRLWLNCVAFGVSQC